jgi:hypothetical protein
MTRKAHVENIVRIKTALADKYERLARTRNSKPRQANLLRLSRRYREQAANAAQGRSA